MSSLCYSKSVILAWLSLLPIVLVLGADEFEYRTKKYVTAIVNYTYVDKQGTRYFKSDLGRFGTNSVENFSGVVSHAWTVSNRTDACAPLRDGVARTEPWVALVSRGNCNFNTKIRNTAILSNATGVVVYNHKDEEHLVVMEHQMFTEVAVFIRKAQGLDMAAKCDAGLGVDITVTVGNSIPYPGAAINQTSVLFVSISFIVLMIISLAWLIFYYIQRFRYAHAKDRMQKRLAHAATRAVSKIPTKVIRSSDREVESAFDPCAVCIEGYHLHDILRILPCKHEFHKTCIDPWLIEHRTCPMCKLDILKAYGLQLTESRRCGGTTILVSAGSSGSGPSTAGGLAVATMDESVVEEPVSEPAQLHQQHLQRRSVSVGSAPVHGCTAPGPRRHSQVAPTDSGYVTVELTASSDGFNTGSAEEGEAASGAAAVPELDLEQLSLADNDTGALVSTSDTVMLKQEPLDVGPVTENEGAANSGYVEMS